VCSYEKDDDVKGNRIKLVNFSLILFAPKQLIFSISLQLCTQQPSYVCTERHSMHTQLGCLNIICVLFLALKMYSAFGKSLCT
jgi:hypothetical protein